MNKCLRDAATKICLWEDLKDRRWKQNMVRMDKIHREIIFPVGDTSKT